MNTLAIEVDTVPTAARDDLARPLLEKVAAYFAQPGVDEKFQAWLVEYKKRKPTTELAGQ